MQKRTLKSILGNYDIELIESQGKKYVATISKTKGKRYLELNQVPKAIRKYIETHYEVALYDVKKLNRMLGLC